MLAASERELGETSIAHFCNYSNNDKVFLNDLAKTRILEMDKLKQIRNPMIRVSAS